MSMKEDETVGAATFLSPQKWRSEPTAFGPTILRAETAAIFAVSILAALCR